MPAERQATDADGGCGCVRSRGGPEPGPRTGRACEPAGARPGTAGRARPEGRGRCSPQTRRRAGRAGVGRRGCGGCDVRGGPAGFRDVQFSCVCLP